MYPTLVYSSLEVELDVMVMILILSFLGFSPKHLFFPNQ